MINCPGSLELYIHQFCLGNSPGHGGNSGGDTGGDTGGSTGGDTDEDSGGGGYDPEIRLGSQCFEKMKIDLSQKKATIQQIKTTKDGIPILDAAGVGLNTTGIITSCLNFLNQTNLDTYAKNFGKYMGLAGLGVGITQTFIAFSDSNISTADILGAVSTALAGVAMAGVFFPPAIVISGIAGVASCVIGLVGIAMSTRSNPLTITKNGERIVYLYLE